MQKLSLVKRVISWIKFWLKPFVLYIRQVTFRRSILYTRALKREKVEENIVLYEVNHHTCQMVRELLKETALEHIWVVKDNSALLEDIRCEHLKYVKWNSRDYFKYLASARYLVNDHSFPPYFQKKKGQIYISTLSEINMDNQKNFSNTQRNLLHVDYLVADKKDSANRILETYRVKDLFCGEIVKDEKDTITKYEPLKKKVRDNKKNLLFYCGGFLNNGITSSAINLLNHIDYDKYNVVVVEKEKNDPVWFSNISKINERAHILFRVGRMNLTLGEYYKNEYIMKKGLMKPKMKKLIPKSLYEREYQRLFGNIHFDVVIDFSGYVPFWSLVFTQSDAKRKVIYQHNDMLEESKKVVDNQLKHKAKMDIIFPLYQSFDKVISVAKFTMELNAKNLKDFIQEEKASYVHNCIDHKKVLNQAINYHEGDYLFPLPEKGNINFLNIGRLSPEKDHQKLIRAFAKVMDNYSNLRLYICGDGPLMEELMTLRNDLGLQDKVIFTGHISNPFYLFRLCDCFILSSNHEGQPMVLLEALILQKPVIATDIPGSRSVLNGRQGILVENSEIGLLEGVDRFIREPFIPENFDYVAYNQEALSMFYKEVCGEEHVFHNIPSNERRSYC